MKVNINACNQDLEINLEEYGKGNKGVPILFVHGIPTNARLWRHVQKNLEGKFHSYAMDMVGYGQSSIPLDNFEHTFNNQAEAIKAVIEGCKAKGFKVEIGGLLYSDDLGGKDSGADTYLSMISKNTSTINAALK